MKRLFIALFAGLLLVGCSSQGNHVGEDAVDPTTEIPAADTPDHSNWENFWGDFQKAVAANDKEQVKALTSFNLHIDEAGFNNETGYDMYFVEGMRKIIAETAAGGVAANEDGAVEASVEDAKRLTLAESTVVEGEEFESALILYFGKIDGKYRLVSWMAAG